MSKTNSIQMYAHMLEMEKCKSDPIYFYNNYIKLSSNPRITMEEYNKEINIFMTKNFIRKHNLQINLVQE